MVQIHGPTRKALLQEAMGRNLGQGLSSFVNNYFAGKALDDVLNKEDYGNAPMSERTSQLERAMRPYGEYGEQVLKNRIGIEQQVQQEQEQRQNAARTVAENKYVNGEKLTAKEDALIRPDLKVAFMKAKQPKGGTTAQPIPPEVQNSISQVLKNAKDMNSDELAAAFGESGVPPIFSNPYVENRRRQDESKQNLNIEKQKLAIKRDADLLSDADKFRALQPTEEVALLAMEDAVTNGDQSFFSLDNLAEQTGFEWARTAKGGQFKTAAKTFLINNVTKFGARPNQYIEQQIADSLAKVGRDAEANLASIALTRFDSDVKKKFIEVLDEVESEGNYSPGTLGREVQNRMQPIVEQMQKSLSNQLHVLSTNESLGAGEVYVYDKDDNIVGTVNQDDAQELPEEYHVK